MNKRFLTPWYPQWFHPNYPSQYIRFGVGSDYEIGVRLSHSPNNETWQSDILFGMLFPTAEEAMAATDEALAKLGYVFLTEEQVEKFQVLV